MAKDIKMRKVVLLAALSFLLLTPSTIVAEEKELDIADSSFIEEAQYDTEDQTLILYIDGNEYQYEDVPEDVAEEFEDAYSAGEYYNENIKGQYDRY
jgi:hypothetical protein